MRLMKREKIFLIILVFVIAEYFLFQYIIVPQNDSISRLQQTKQMLEEDKKELLRVKETLTKQNAEKEELEKQIQTLGNQYFSVLEEQEETLIILHELLTEAGTEDTAILFYLPEIQGKDKKEKAEEGKTQKKPEENEILMQKIRLSYTGTYEETWSLLRALWSFQKNIEISGVNIAQKTDAGLQAETLTGELELSLYDLSGITRVENNLVEWAESGSYRKGNPFSAISGDAFPGTRYELKKSDTDTSKYIKFVDIAGNWAEPEIDDFGRRLYITGDYANRFFPDNAISRGEFVIMLDKVFKWEAPEQPVDLTGFSDYTELGQSLSAMEKAFYKGYLMEYFVGYNDGSLRPNAPISYKEFEIVMRRILNQPDFDWSTAAAEIERDRGYSSKGNTDKTASVTRAEAVYFLASL